MAPEKHTDGEQDELIGEDRCWPCTVANAVVGGFVALVPLLAALVTGRTALIAITTVWAVAVIGFTGYRLVKRGYLPLAKPAAKVTGLRKRIGPGSKVKADQKDTRQ